MLDNCGNYARRKQSKCVCTFPERGDIVAWISRIISCSISWPIWNVRPGINSFKNAWSRCTADHLFHCGKILSFYTSSHIGKLSSSVSPARKEQNSKGGEIQFVMNRMELITPMLGSELNEKRHDFRTWSNMFEDKTKLCSISIFLIE